MKMKWIKVKDQYGSDHRIRIDRIIAYRGGLTFGSDTRYEIQFTLLGSSDPHYIFIEKNDLEKILPEIDKELFVL